MSAIILLIGCGNSLRGDDAVGFQVAGRLAEQARLMPNCRALECLAVVQLTPDLAERISHSDFVIFVDAGVGITPGEIIARELPGEQTRIESVSTAFTHHVTPETLLRSAGIWYGKSPPGCLYTITGGSFELGDALSAPVQGALPALLASLNVRIAKCMNSASPAA